MKITTAITTLLVAGSATLFSATAEGSRGARPERPGRPKRCAQKGDKECAERMFKALELTEEQQTKVKAIMKAHHDEMQALHDQMKKKRETIRRKSGAVKPSREDMQGRREAMRTKMNAMRDALHKKIRAVLTAEQQTKFDKITAKMKERRQERRQQCKTPGKGRRGGRGPKKESGE